MKALIVLAALMSVSSFTQAAESCPITESNIISAFGNQGYDASGNAIYDKELVQKVINKLIDKGYHVDEEQKERSVIFYNFNIEKRYGLVKEVHASFTMHPHMGREQRVSSGIGAMFYAEITRSEVIDNTLNDIPECSDI